jgi:RNase H-like domain found in reverse transcriptase
MVMETDASDYALGAILSLFDDEGVLHPVAFHSRTFTGAELNYNVHDKELLATFKAFQHWQHYLEGSGSPIDVVTEKTKSICVLE